MTEDKEYPAEDKPSIEELLSLLIIQEIRNYDVLMHILNHHDRELSIQLRDLHERGELWGSMPFSFEE